MADDHALIGGEALKHAAAKYLGQFRTSAPLGIFDNWFIRVMTQLSALDPSQPWENSVAGNSALGQDLQRLRLFLDRWMQGRFVAYEQRKKSGAHYHPKYGTEFGPDVLLMVQGAPALMEWRGLPLMKTAFDYAIYPQLLAALRPRTIFEIGSGSGASALWLADHLALLGIEGHVHSVDLTSVKAAHPAVTFYPGDCAHPEKLFPPDLLSAAPHPWLVIEDAHQNVEAVLNFFHGHLRKGDYLYVEDSEIKRDTLRNFCAAHPEDYRVDTKHTDFFGRNATCAMDSILVRVKD